jgi:hypothetical protein
MKRMYETQQVDEQEKIFRRDYEKNRVKLWELVEKIEDPLVKEALNTLHDMCTSFTIYHVAKHIREELGLDAPDGPFEKGQVCFLNTGFLKLVDDNQEEEGLNEPK